eukprot:TRINITY_DN8071_c0_g1_i6.p1 TRINITY_DN8071_c0_g1~~TRINITY_DN8071_c0_g1_i6.p1  ORF type:complete len:1175 (+),score=224.08 TRINITY_DN8071_c0_g1_i6:186-3527(+)
MPDLQAPAISELPGIAKPGQVPAVLTDWSARASQELAAIGDAGAKVYQEGAKLASVGTNLEQQGASYFQKGQQCGQALSALAAKRPGLARSLTQHLAKSEVVAKAEAVLNITEIQGNVHEYLRHASTAVKEKAETTAMKASPEEEELAQLKVETMQRMVTDITYSMGESVHTSRMMYFTAKQAVGVTLEQMPKVREALNIHEPKLVIRLIPSMMGRTYWSNRPWSTKLNPQRRLPELKGEEELSELELNLVAKEVLLPMALKSHALVVGHSSCSMTAAFAMVSAPIQRQYGDACPFRVVIFENAMYMHKTAELQPGSLACALRDSNAAWTKADFVPALTKKFGYDPAFWPEQRLVEGAAGYVIFESLDAHGNADMRAADQFLRMFVSSLHSYLPAVALWTYGDADLKLAQGVAELVGTGFPLILLDSRRRDTRDPTLPPPDTSNLPAEVSERLQALPPTVAQAANQLLTATHELNEAGMIEFFTASAIACMRSGIDLMAERYEGIQKRDRHRIDKNLWLCDAIIEATLESAHYLNHDTEIGLDTVEKACSNAVEFLLALVGSQQQEEARRNNLRFENGIVEVASAQNYKELQELWQSNLPCFLNSFLYSKTGLDFTVDDVNIVKMTKRKKITADGFFRVDINVEELDQKNVDFDEVLDTLLVHLQEELQSNIEWDDKRNNMKKWLSDSEMWLAVYAILKSDHTFSCGLRDHDSLKKRMHAMTRSERLPDNTSMQGLMLMRCAWTLVDLYRYQANQYKLLTKIAYVVILLLGIVVVFITTTTVAETLPADVKKFTVLGLGLASSSLATWITFTDPMKKWLKLRSGAQILTSEIWKFRCRVASYATAEKIQTSSQHAERKAETQFRKMIVAVKESVVGGGLQDTSFFSKATVSDDINIQVDGDAPREDFLKELKQRHSKSRLTASLFKHHQYSGKKEPPKRNEDSHHAPASPDEYICWRVTPLLDFYRRRVPIYSRIRLFMQACFIASSVTTAILAAADHVTWSAFVVSTAGALAALQEFVGVGKKLERYATVIDTLSNLILWWEALPDVDKANVRHIEMLVDMAESAVASEHSSWLSDAQKAQKLVERAVQRQESDNSNAQEVNRTSEVASPFP